MSGLARNLTLEQKQLELRARCRHPTGSWQPVDWQRPHQTIPDRIATVAQSTPDRLAVYDPQTSLTYAGLDRAANQVANAILALRGPDQEVVTLLVGVDVPAVTAALGALKAGKIYAGLDASLPQKRLSYILADTDAKLILTDRLHLAQAQELAGSERLVIQLEALAAGDPRSPNVPVPVDALALLNYTSGTTGQPKGVVQTHGSAYLQAVRYASDYCVSDADRLVFRGSLAYAASFWAIFGPLCLGATTAPFDLRRHGMHQLVTWLLDTEPTILGGLTVSRHIAYNYPDQRFPSVRLVSMGGDTIFREDVQACMRVFPKALIATGFGLSEAGRATQLLFDSPEMLDWDVLPLGLPVPGLKIELLGDDGREVEPGEVGEIIVLGRGLAAGYWRRPDLTADRFRTFASLDPEPAYLTGDLGRLMPDGLLQHVGRKDHMVKIRGYQVFTNEIEDILRKVEGVKEVCVMAHILPEGTRRLVAYLVVDAQRFPGVAALYAQFKDIARYMAPQSYVLLENLPRSPTGKVDRSRLAVPRRSRLDVTAEYVAARDPTEEALALIWGELLRIDDLGIRDNFLELGGDSLDATRIISRIAAIFKVDISPSEFFNTLTIAEMASMIRTAR
ncbi:AMP-binding protein [Chloroflexota bacterium]